MSLMNSFREMVADAIASLAIAIENRNERHGITRVDSTDAIGRLFHYDSARQQLDHEVATGRRVGLENNSRELGRI
jgi:hypothetical protein